MKPITTPPELIEEELHEQQLPAVHDAVHFWRNLVSVPLNEKHLKKQRMIALHNSHPAHVAFDMLRTRLFQELAERGWTRVAITSPTAACGKSFVAGNLALSLSRLEEVRTVLMELDLRNPSLASTFGVAPLDSMQEYLAGRIEPEDFMLRVRDNLALGLCDQPVPNASEVLQESMTAYVLDELQESMDPEIMLIDLPPALAQDDVLAVLPNVDAVLLVVGGGTTTADEIRRVEQLLGDVKPLLGVVLNKTDGPTSV